MCWLKQIMALHGPCLSVLGMLLGGPAVQGQLQPPMDFTAQLMAAARS